MLRVGRTSQSTRRPEGAGSATAAAGRLGRAHASRICDRVAADYPTVTAGRAGP
ncbi:MAG: hypothetical protein AVDCRST_MAG72-758 [uncultured Nocardioidaceae bacterium]|uniref:Uncharacterized protein n=1 Tax=uncultured Nocardioidaceae bacterium TaxID=253824 RepID=A0A6J4LR49_9ACTN|nr:MAG: hypothetical protein AVDCRST_MAG72-758 [uncultured Nocardioidaceae bacterium]